MRVRGSIFGVPCNLGGAYPPAAGQPARSIKRFHAEFIPLIVSRSSWGSQLRTVSVRNNQRWVGNFSCRDGIAEKNRAVFLRLLRHWQTGQCRTWQKVVALSLSFDSPVSDRYSKQNRGSYCTRYAAAEFLEIFGAVIVTADGLGIAPMVVPLLIAWAVVRQKL